MKEGTIVLVIFVLILVVPIINAADEAVIIIQNSKYSPPELTIELGQKVTWVNGDASKTHQVYESYNKFPRSPVLMPQDQYQHTFDELGSYEYRDAARPSEMIGYVSVVPVGSIEEEDSEQECYPGWKCKTQYYMGFQNSDCSWDHLEACIKGCVDGKCIEEGEEGTQPAVPCSDYSDTERIDIPNGYINVKVYHHMTGYDPNCEEESSDDTKFDVYCDDGYEANINGRQSSCSSERSQESSSLDLSNYPAPFVEDCIPNFLIVIGEKASPESVIGQSNIVTELENCESGGKVNIPVGTAKLTSEIADYSAQNIISVGNACENPITADIMNNPSNCKEGLKQGEGTIQLFDTGEGNKALVVVGYGPAETKAAATVLTNYKDHSLKGNKIVVNADATIKDIDEEIDSSKKESEILDISSLISNSENATTFLNPDSEIQHEFKIFGEQHSLSIDDVGSNQVTLTTNEATVLVEKFESVNVDLNNDGNSDFAITLESIENGVPKLKFSKATSDAPTQPIETPNTLNFEKLKPYLMFIIGVPLLALLIFGAVKLNKSKGFIRVEKTDKAKQAHEHTEEIVQERRKVPFNPHVNEAISVSNFTLKAGRNVILDNVSFKVSRGDMVCLLGGSGTGKSTLIESLVGRKHATKGTLNILGSDITKNQRIYDYVGFVPQHAELYTNQTVVQNLINSATKWRVPNAKHKIENALSKIGLSNRKDLKAGKLSGGQQKLLSLGMELIRDIEVCILDEPTTGLDPNTRNNIITILSRISTQLNKTIFFTTHFMDDAEECDQVIILGHKNIITQGPPSKLEKRLPGSGRVVNVILDNVTDDLLQKIEKIDGIKKTIREGRNLRIITDEPNAIRLGNKIDEIGGIVNEAKIDKATMMDVFVYYTGKKLE